MMVARDRKRRRKMRKLPLLLLVLLLALIASVSAGAGFVLAVTRDLPTLQAQDEYETAQTTKIFDSGSPPTLLAELHGVENRVLVTGDAIPKHMRDAVVAIEDQRFYEHGGVDLMGILRALIADIRHGGIVQGGSTITQQFIKNAFITDERTLNRKLKEAALAYQLEQRWSKDKILNEYLNIIYFGEGAYGVEAAAQAYFGVSASQLSIAQAAMLAAIPKAPSHYSPRRYPEAALQRRNLVLNNMFQQEYVSAKQLQQALDEDLDLAAPQAASETEVPYWVALVREQLVAKYGSNTVLQGGLRVYTSIDLRKQRAAEKAVAGILNEPDDPSAALVSIDLETGRIVAMIGGSDFSEQQFNVAVQGNRQPGSAFKPFVLVTALEQGMTPYTVYESGPATISLPNKDWKVRSSDIGSISLVQAITRSSNGVFARLIMDVGPKNVVETARRMGITAPLDPLPAIALGGLTTGVSPLEMASAYATLGTQGNRLQGSLIFDPERPQFPVSIIRVESADGKLLDGNELVRTRVLDPAIAYETTTMLQQVIARGTGTAAQIGRPAAGKTGTTQRYRDAWFVGYTPQLVTAVWVGYPHAQQEMTDVHGRKVTGGSFPAQIWAAYMIAAHEGIEPTDFPQPAGVDWVTVQIDPESGLLSTEWCETTRDVRFISGTQPTEECPLHSPKETSVPDVTGMPLEKAQRILEEAKYMVEVVEKIAPQVETGIVLAQKPSQGTLYMQRQTVTLTVASMTTPAGTVPVLIGLKKADAYKLLSESGYAVAAEYRTSQQPKDLVIDQQPFAGSLLDPGGRVTVIISSGSTTTSTNPPTHTAVTVPSLTGLSLQAARDALQEVGLRAEIARYQPAPDEESIGRVLAQEPAAGDELPVGSAVSLTVYQQP